MTSSARVATPEAAAIAERAARHFAHKVAVERAGPVVRVAVPAGRFELEPAETALALRAEADDEDLLARVEEVVATHVERFARVVPVSVSWTRA